MKSYRIEKQTDPRQIMLAVWNCVCEALQGNSIVIEIKLWSKSREQEKKYHSMLRDISQQVEVQIYDEMESPVPGLKRKYDLNVWKAMKVEQFAHDMAQMGTPLRYPLVVRRSWDRLRWITVRPSSKEFSVKEGSDFIEYLYSFGAEMGVVWSDPEIRNYQEYPEAQHVA